MLKILLIVYLIFGVVTILLIPFTDYQEHTKNTLIDDDFDAKTAQIVVIVGYVICYICWPAVWIIAIARAISSDN